jgi:TolA-binding protein
MAQGQSAQAAKAFLDGYQKYPKSDRGADSLIGLGGALTALKKPEQACKAYNELQAVYGAKLTASQKDAVAKARTTAKCDG